MLGLLVLGVAWAGGFVHRATRDPLPAREVERDLVLPKGWSEVAVGGGSTRWAASPSPRPFEGELRRGEVTAAARLSVGDRAELRARLPWVDVRTRGPLGAGLGAASVGASWSLGRGVAPPRSMALEVDWTAPDGHPRLPLGAAGHGVVGQLAVRRSMGALRWTGRLGGVWHPAGRVGWLRDAADRAQRLDVADGVRASLGVLGQGGPLGLRAELRAGWYSGDRVDSVVVTPAGAASDVTVGGFVQLNRAVQLGVDTGRPVLVRSSWLAPLPLAADPGRGVHAWLSVAL